MKSLDISPERIVAWLGTYDYPLLVATGIRCVLEEFPASMHLMFQDPSSTFDVNQFKQGICDPVRLGQLFGSAQRHANYRNGAPRQSRVLLIFGLTVRPRCATGDDCSCSTAQVISLRFHFYLGENGTIRQIRTNSSVFDSLGMFYSVISSTQGGWTALSSEGRYMGAAAFGDINRSTNRCLFAPAKYLRSEAGRR